MPAGRFGSEAAGTLDVWLYDHSGPKEAADVLGFLCCATYCAVCCDIPDGVCGILLRMCVFGVVC